MIINGQAVKGANRLANHLLKDENEHVHILEISGTASNDNLHDALKDMELLGELTQSRTGKVLYHANIDPRKNETLTPEQYIKSADKLMKELGFEGQPRAIVQHVKKGRQHAHLVVQLTDVEKGKLKKVSNNYYKHKQVARELEKIFQLEKTSEKKRGNSYTQKEAQQINKLQLNPKQLKIFLRGRYLSSQTGREFRDQIATQGFSLAQGKRIVVVDRNGHPLSLSRQLGSIAKARHVREKFKDIIDELPPIEKAQELARERKIKENNIEFDRSALKYERLKKEFHSAQVFDGIQESAEKRRQYYKTLFDHEKGH